MNDMRAANQVVKRMRAALPFEVRRAWGLRLQAIKGGRAVQRMYRMRGIDPLKAANEAKAKKLKLRRIKQLQNGDLR